MRQRNLQSTSSYAGSPASSLSPRYSRSSERSDSGQEDDSSASGGETRLTASLHSPGSETGMSSAYYPESTTLGSRDSKTHSSEATSPMGHVSPRSFVSNSSSDCSPVNRGASFHRRRAVTPSTLSSCSFEVGTPPQSGRTKRATKQAIASNVSQVRNLELDELAPPDLGESSRRKRVPGGAAAKLMLIGPKESEEELKDEDPAIASDIIVSHDADHDDKAKAVEIDEQMKRVKAEFKTGTQANRRYIPKDPSFGFIDHDKDVDEASDAPSFLNRSEIFHDSAAAAVNALLKPQCPGDDESLPPTLSGHEDVFASQSTVGMGSSPVASVDALTDATSYESPVKRDFSQSLLTARTERRLESLQAKMKSPNATLTNLLTAIASPGTEESEMDLGFMVRRKNACGALHVLTTEPKNRSKICYTIGVLPALTSVLIDGNGSGKSALLRAFPDSRIRAEYQAARNRAVSTLMNLVMPKENRIAVFHTPSLINAVVQIVHDDEEGVARKGCCTIVAYLGKSIENRRLLAQIPGLLDSLSTVLSPNSSLSVVPVCPDSTSKRVSKRQSVMKNDGNDGDDEYEPCPLRSTAPLSPTSNSEYDSPADELIRESRQNVFALLHHLIKEKDNAYLFARHFSFICTLVEISNFQTSPSHVLAVKILACLTRHRLNTKTLVFQKRIVLPALVKATHSSDAAARLYACHALQNFAQDKSCRQELATTDDLIVSLCERARNGSQYEERLAAVSAIKNMCDEPANLIPMTNAPDAVSTLMHLAREISEETTELMQYIACDALATLSHWLRKIATSGKTLDAKKAGLLPAEGLCVPTLRPVTWNQWE